MLCTLRVTTGHHTGRHVGTRDRTRRAHGSARVRGRADRRDAPRRPQLSALEEEDASCTKAIATCDGQIEAVRRSDNQLRRLQSQREALDERRRGVEVAREELTRRRFQFRSAAQEARDARELQMRLLELREITPPPSRSARSRSARRGGCDG